MTATLKLGLALLLSGFLFFSPLGCAESMSADAKPAHPCCPKTPTQVQIDCGRPGCVYLEAKLVVVEAPASIDHEFAVAPEIANLIEQPHYLPWGGAEAEASQPEDPRYLKFHQLLL